MVRNCNMHNKQISTINFDDVTDNISYDYKYIEHLFTVDNNLTVELDEMDESWIYREKEDGIFISSYSAFNSICELGKMIIDRNEFTNINEIDSEKDLNEDTYKKIMTLIFNWIKLNGYPYSHFAFDYKDFSPKYPLIQFAYDAVFCFLAKEIHSAMIYLQDAFDYDVISELKQNINFLNLGNNFKEIVDYTNIHGIVFKELGNYDEYEQYLNNFNKGFVDIPSIKYQESVDTMLLTILAYTMTYRDYDFRITTQRPFYIPAIEKYCNYETAQSIVGIAYNKLLIFLIDDELEYNIIPCKHCHKFFHSKNGAKYCNSKECQKYRNRKKSKDSYNRNKKKESS